MKREFFFPIYCPPNFTIHCQPLFKVGPKFSQISKTACDAVPWILFKNFLVYFEKSVKFWNFCLLTKNLLVNSRIFSPGFPCKHSTMFDVFWIGQPIIDARLNDLTVLFLGSVHGDSTEPLTDIPLWNNPTRYHKLISYYHLKFDFLIHGVLTPIKAIRTYS